MASGCTRGALGWISENISSPEGLSSIGTGHPGQWWSHHRHRCGTWEHGLVVDLSLLGLRLDSMTFQVVSNLSDSKVVLPLAKTKEKVLLHQPELQVLFFTRQGKPERLCRTMKAETSGGTDPEKGRLG